MTKTNKYPIQNNKIRIEANKFNDDLNKMQNSQNKPENIPALNKDQTGWNESNADFNGTNQPNEKIVILTLLAVGFFLRIAASTLMDGHNDINLFKNWAETAAKGISQFYSNAKSADYPPLYIYVLALIGKIASISYLKTYFVLLLKIPSIIADVVTAYLIYKLGKKYFSSIIGTYYKDLYKYIFDNELKYILIIIN